MGCTQDHRRTMAQLARARPACVVVVLLCTLRATWALKRNVHNDIDILPGWEGTDTQPSIPTGVVQPDLLEHRTGRMKVLDAEARIFLFENFISDEDCDHIVKMSEKRMSRSGVVGQEGTSDTSEIRTSFGTFLERGEDEVIRRHEEKIARWTLLPVENGEGLQVLRYHKTQKYEAHFDYFFHKEGIENGGNRYATVLCYLADTEEGGETVFPNVPAPGGVNEGFSECARYHLAAKPKKGTCVLFHSIKPNGELERKSMHTACPVIKGVKWSAAKWIHVGRWAVGSEPWQRIEQHPQKIPKKVVPGCEDKDAQCEDWANSGECDHNPGFMVGERANPGHCILSCNRCDLVAQPEQAQQASLSRKVLSF